MQTNQFTLAEIKESIEEGNADYRIIAELVKMAEHLTVKLDTTLDQHEECVAALEKALEKALDRIAELEKALEPFAPPAYWGDKDLKNVARVLKER